MQDSTLSALVLTIFGSMLHGGCHWGRHGFDGGAEVLVACTSAKDDANTFGNQNSQQQRCRSRGLKNR
jgi:hypothetical protein